MTGPQNVNGKGINQTNTDATKLTGINYKKDATTGEINIFGTLDGNQNNVVEKSEANINDSVFGDVRQAANESIKSIVGNDTASSASVSKFFNVSSWINDALNSFKDIQYSVQTENGATEGSATNFNHAQAEVNAKIESEISRQTGSMKEAVQQNISTATANAKAAFSNERDTTTDTDKDGIPDSMMYQRKEGEAGVATYSSANRSGSKEDIANNKPTAGYTGTVKWLTEHGAKAKTKLVNGQEQEIYKYNDKYYTVDDAGQMHELQKNKGFLRESKFTTVDSIEDAKAQAGGEISDVKVKVRKVDGKNQSVMTYKDSEGKEHARVIDHNEVTGQTSSSEVHHVSSGGRAKYSSNTSGLGTLAANSTYYSYDDDDENVSGGRFRDNRSGYTVSTNHARTKLDAQNIGDAVRNIEKLAREKAGATVTYPKNEDAQNITNITINGHTYTIDKRDVQAADRTMRLIQSEIDNAKPQGSAGQVDIGTIDARDNRQASAYGVNNLHDNTPTTSKINTISYDNDSNGGTFSKADFNAEGWYTKDRSGEREYLRSMDAAANDNNSKLTGANGTDGKRTRNGGDFMRLSSSMNTAAEFTDRFVDTLKEKYPELKNAVIDTKELANAIKTANPSFFDENGNMYKNCDWNRLNLPKLGNNKAMEAFKKHYIKA